MSRTIVMPNRQDYYRFFWLFLVVMLLLAAGLFRWMVQLSALALLLYVLIAFSFQKAFVYQLSIRSNEEVLLKKCFAGFCYWKKKIRYQYIVLDNYLKIYRFVNSQSYCTLEIQQGRSQLQFVFPKKEVIIRDKKAINIFEKQFKKLLEQKEIQCYQLT